MTSGHAVEARFSTLTLDTRAAFHDICRVLRGGVDLPTHPPVSIEGSALERLRHVTPSDIAGRVHDAICEGSSLTVGFTAPDVAMEWVEAMTTAGFTCDWGPPSVFKLYWTMRKAQGVVKLAVLDPGVTSTRLGGTQTSEFLLTEGRLSYKVQVAGENIAEATKPSYLGTQYGHRPACWYYVDVDKTATVVYKM